MNHIISPSSAQWFIPIASGSHGQRASLLSSVLDFCLDPNFFRLMRKITKETSVRTNTGLSMLALAWPLLSHYQFSSGAQSCPTLCDPMNCSTPGLPVHHQLQEFTQTHVHQVSDAIQPSHPLLLLPSIPPSIRVFSNESTLHIRWPKC